MLSFYVSCQRVNGNSSTPKLKDFDSKQNNDAMQRWNHYKSITTCICNVNPRGSSLQYRDRIIKTSLYWIVFSGFVLRMPFTFKDHLCVETLYISDSSINARGKQQSMTKHENC